MPVWDERDRGNFAIVRPALFACLRQQIDGDPPRLEQGRAILRQCIAELSFADLASFQRRAKRRRSISLGRLARDRRWTAVSRLRASKSVLRDRSHNRLWNAYDFYWARLFRNSRRGRRSLALPGRKVCDRAACVGRPKRP